MTQYLINTAVLSVLSVLFVLSAVRADTTPQKDDYLVGVYYFAGWWRETPNKYVVAGTDWRAEYPGRVALLGEFNEQATMDREIIAASEHGVDFFQILWYPRGDQLNEGVRTFIASPNAGRMKFTVEFVNHPPFDIPTDAEWEACCREWCAFMKHPSYLRVGGRPVFKVHGAHYFFQQNGGDPVKVAARLDALRRLARESGLPDPLMSGGVMPGAVASDPAVASYDFLTTYMDMPGLPQKEQPYPYELLVKHAQAGWMRYARHSYKPYVPYVPSGWDPRPWKDPRPSFEMPGRDDWTFALRRVKAALDRHPKLGVPVAGGRQKMLLIYAWNEFGEGGIVAPTKGEGYMKLEALREVFR